jgi:ketosteroid isomerase-like protein
MYKWAVRYKIRQGTNALTAGNLEPLLAGFADDAVFIFPGTSSWGGEYRGKPAIAGFLQSFLRNGLVGQTHEILVNGPPWRTSVCMIFTDRALNDSGEVLYENRAVIYARVRWGKILYQEDFLDTVKVDAFDRLLQERAR